MPRLYVTPDRQPNAFATGRSPRHAVVAVTRGLLELLTPRELRAVLAHELAHVGNRDVLLTSVAAALATGISFLANMIGWLPFFGSSDDEDHPGPMAAFVAALLAPFAAVPLQLALSRSREFEADRTGATLVGDGFALASALAKIEHAARSIPMRVDPAQATKYIVNPLTGRSGWSVSVLFSTHPPVAERIARSPVSRSDRSRDRAPLVPRDRRAGGSSRPCRRLEPPRAPTWRRGPVDRGSSGRSSLAARLRQPQPGVGPWASCLGEQGPSLQRFRCSSATTVP